MWIPGHVGRRGNDTADRTAREALNKEPADGLMPFSDIKPLTAKYVHQVWQKKWDYVGISNTLHEIFTKAVGQMIILLQRKERRHGFYQIIYWPLMFEAFFIWKN